MPGLLQVGTVPPADTVNVADSLMATAQDIVSRIAADPGQVFTDFLGNAVNFGLKVLGAVIVYSVGAWLIKKVRKLIIRIFDKRGTDKAVGTFLASFISITLTVILLVITVSTLGVNTTSIAALLAGGGVAVGLALNGTMQNLAGGLIILAFKPFRAGDYIKALGYEGYVEEVNIMSTKLRTFANSIIVLPNGALSGGEIDNFTHNAYHRIEWDMKVPYGQDLGRLKGELLNLALSDERVAKEAIEGTHASPPDVWITEFNDSSTTFRLVAWARVEDYWDVLYDINARIYNEFEARGIKFYTYNHMNVHVVGDKDKS